MRYSKLAFITFNILGALAAPNCGKGIGSCPSGECCSKYGYCGSSTDYCGTGCQASYGICGSGSPTITTIKKTTTTKKATATSSLPLAESGGRCGSGIAICPDDECCSKYGYCGLSTAYCGSGCQSSFGNCGSATAATTTIKKTTTTTKKATATSSLPIAGSDGKCGPDVAICPSGECCSKYGYCGSTEEYCSNCQTGFGDCGSSTTTPPTTTTGSTSTTPVKFYTKCNKSNQWALTFDDGSYIYDEDLLDLLKEKGVKATFFVNGSNFSEITDASTSSTIKRMYNEGHIVASHTWRHIDLEETSESGIISDVTKLENAIYKIIKKKPAIIRPPYGSGNGSSTVSKILGKFGYNSAIMWNVDTKDYDNKGNIDYALARFKEKLGQGIISLNHNAYSGITKSKLINLVSEEIDYMIENGYTPVTIDKCIGKAAYKN